MRVLSVVGARPQLVKAAVVSRAFAGRAAGAIEEVLVHTGQHTDVTLSSGLLEGMDVAMDVALPDVNLALGEGSGPSRTARMARGLIAEIERVGPGAVVAYGDTDTTLATTLAARACGVPLAHVEAGLRSDVMAMPEEQNRVVTDHLSALLLCPTRSAVERLVRERAAGTAVLVGDVMLDACKAATAPARGRGAPARLGVAVGEYYLATVHRASTADSPTVLAGVLAALGDLALPVVFPCHPRTRRAIDGVGGAPPAVRLVDPLPYLDLIGLIADARAVLTDSGGVQKEAFFLSVPCVTLRAETEWTETVASGWNRLAGTSVAGIRAAVIAAERPAGDPDLDAFGGGIAGERVADEVARLLG